jgi:predicted RecB family endonuclease
MTQDLTPDAVAEMLKRLSESLEIEAADMMEALAAEAALAAMTAERDEAMNQLDSAQHSVDVLEGRVAEFMVHADLSAAREATARREGWEAAKKQAAAMARSHLTRLPNYRSSDDLCQDRVEQGYGNACVNIAESIAAMKEIDQ